MNTSRVLFRGLTIQSVGRADCMKVRDTIQPRDWQKAALNRWCENMRGIAHVVTGGGKTVFSYLCMEHFFDSYSGGRVSVVVPTLALMDQWAIDIVDSMTIDPDDVSCFSGLEKAAQPNKVNIVVMNTARGLSDWLSDGAPTFLIVDECHRAATIENSKCLLSCHVASLGLSATPYREQDSGFEEYLLPYLGSVIFEYTYRDAHKQKVIVDFELINIDIALSEEVALGIELDLGIADAVESNKSSGRRLKSRRRVTTASRVAWAVKLSLSHREERIVIFHERIDSLALISRALFVQGITSVAYHSRMASAHRRDNLRLYRKGEVNILVTCRALDEGTNIPESNVAIIAQSTSSTRQRIQRMGRVLRPAKGKRHATIYTLFDAPDQEDQLREEEAGLVGVARTKWQRGYFS